MEEHLLLDALHDSPSFRLRLKQIEGQFEESVKQQDTAVRSIRSVVEEHARMVELIPRVADNIKPIFLEEQIKIIDPALFLTADYNVRSGISKTIGSKILRDLLTHRQPEVDRVRECKRAYERALDRYESVMTKHALSLKRPGDVKREPGSDTGDLTNARKAYYQCMADLLEQLYAYKQSGIKYWSEKTGVYISILREGESLLSQLYNASFKIEDVEKAKIDLVDFKKKFLLQVEQEFDLAKAMSHRLTEKHGHLFRKRTRGMGPPWRLVYVSIEKGLFKFWSSSISSASLATTNSSSSNIPSSQSPVTDDSDGSSDTTNVLLCQIKLYESVERACCFEVSTPQRSFVFQALSEEELMDWLRVFENAKNSAVTPLATSAESALESGDLISETDSQFSVIDGVPENVLIASNRFRKPLVYVSDLVLFDDHLGTLSCTINEIIHFSLQMDSIDWSEIEKYEVINSNQNLSTSVTLQLQNRIVDAPVGRAVTIVFLDNKQHSTSANTFTELCRLLSGPRKTVHTEDQLVEVLYGKKTGADDSNYNEDEEGGLADIYPKDFIFPQNIDDEVDQVESDSDLDSLELDMSVGLPASLLFNLLFIETELMQALLQRRKNTQIHFDELKESLPDDGGGPVLKKDTKSREITYNVPLNNPIIKAKETKCNEKVTMKVVQPFLNYLIDVTASTPDILYGDAFQTRSRFQIIYKTKTTCHLKGWFGMKWARSVLVKSIIRSAAAKGFAEYCRELKGVVREEVGKRRKNASLDGDASDGSSSATFTLSGSNIRKSNYSVYIVILAIILIFALRLLTSFKNVDQHVYRMRRYHRDIPLLSIRDILEQAVESERVIERAKYVRFLYELLNDCVENNWMAENADCLEAAKEWKKMMKY